MKNGFVKVAAATPDIRVADVEFNTQNIINAMEEAQKNGAKILVFPELCVTGYTCSDLFDHSVLLKASRKALLEIAENTNDKDMLVFVGAPLEVNGKLYNVAAAMNQARSSDLRQRRSCQIMVNFMRCASLLRDHRQ